MKHTLRILKPSLMLVMLLFSTVLTSTAQVQKSATYAREQLIETALNIIKTARYCALITTDPTGRPRARAMDPFAPEDDMTIWLGTNVRSRKVAEIRRNPRVTIYYFDRAGQSYVSIQGRARLVNDPGAKAKKWKDEWKAYYPDRARDYLLIAVAPERMEVISENESVIGNARTWRPPFVLFKSIKGAAK